MRAAVETTGRPDVDMDLPPLTYLSVDSMVQGVGASQVLPYIEALSRRGMTVTLHSMERGKPSTAVAERLEAAGVAWRPHRWGGDGSVAGLARLVRGGVYLHGAPLVHARSDIPAGSALLARCPAWIWDMRGFWADERLAGGLLRSGSSQERLMRTIERGAARRARAIVTLAESAGDVLESRHGCQVRDKTFVITTCVDLEKFSVSPMPAAEPLSVLLAGTLSRRYDVPVMLRLVDELRRRQSTELVTLVPEPSPWEAALIDAGSAPHGVAGAEMPGHVAASHVGLCVLRSDGGVSLRASMPTKVGEFLACGRPVVVNAGLGDLDRLVVDHDCGVIVAANDEEALRGSADDILRLVADPETPRRCREVAETYFNLETGVASLLRVYRRTAERHC